MPWEGVEAGEGLGGRRGGRVGVLFTAFCAMMLAAGVFDSQGKR